MGTFKIASYIGIDIDNLFNNNLECFSNHIQIKNKIFYYSFEGEKVSLNMVKINDVGKVQQGKSTVVDVKHKDSYNK